MQSFIVYLFLVFNGHDINLIIFIFTEYDECAYPKHFALVFKTESKIYISPNTQINFVFCPQSIFVYFVIFGKYSVNKERSFS